MPFALSNAEIIMYGGEELVMPVRGLTSWDDFSEVILVLPFLDLDLLIFVKRLAKSLETIEILAWHLSRTKIFGLSFEIFLRKMHRNFLTLNCPQKKSQRQQMSPTSFCSLGRDRRIQSILCTHLPCFRLSKAIRKKKNEKWKEETKNRLATPCDTLPHVTKLYCTFRPMF